MPVEASAGECGVRLLVTIIRVQLYLKNILGKGLLLLPLPVLGVLGRLGHGGWGWRMGEGGGRGAGLGGELVGT